MLKLRHVFLRTAASSENDQGSMNLASNTASLPCNPAIERRRHPAQHRMPDLPLDIGNHLPGIGLDTSAD